jgi:hypothetical protein
MADRKANLKRTSEDRSFGNILRTKSTGQIVPEVVNRFEAGRRLYVRDAVIAAEAERTLIVKECARIEEKGERQGARRSRLAWLLTAVENDLENSRITLDAIERDVASSPGEWRVIGRVLRRDGSVPEKVEVVFVDANNEPVKGLKVLKPARDGMVRNVYPATTVERLSAQGVTLAAAVRAGGRIIATEERPARIRPDGVHQFDLRVETAL